MAVFDHSLDLPFDGIFFNAGILSWAARNASKPGRADEEIWMLHAARGWPADIEPMDAQTADQAMVADFFRYTGQTPKAPRHIQSREWKTAAAEKALEEGCLWDGAARIGICGDWCAGSRIEGAFLSGSAMAGRLLAAAPRLVPHEAAAR